jgi:hypothetical protein
VRGLARLAMRGPMVAAGCAAALALGSMVFGILLIPAGAIIALTTLRFGAREGLKVAAVAASMLVVARVGMGHGFGHSLLLATTTWLPAWLLANGLRARRAQDWPLLMCAAMTVLCAAALRLAVGDVTAFWRDKLKPLFDLMAKDAGARFSAEQMEFIAGQMHSWTLIAIFVLFSGTLLLARWWQSELYNPGGFGSEFRELRFPRGMTWAAGALSLAYAFGRDGGLVLALAGDACVLLVVLFALQGLAVIHFLARVRGLAGAWLTTLYVMLVLVPQVAGPILATTGLADNIVDLRRLRGSRQP